MGIKKGSSRLTKKEMYSEILKCTKSCEYYLQNYGKVYNAKKGYVPFNLYEYQKEGLKDFQNHRFNITLKSRQTGLSTLAAGYIAWMVCFFQAKEIVIVADKQDNAQGFIRKVKTFIRKSPQWMVPTITSDNKKSLEFGNGSRVSAQATTANAGRSESLSLLVIDEAAIIESSKVDDLWAAAFPTLSMGGSALIISTPKGVGNFYHKQWLNAINKESDFNPIVIHWTQNPIYAKDLEWNCTSPKCGKKQEKEHIWDDKCEFCDEKIMPTSPWYEEQKKQLGDPRKVAQELDMNFLGSGDNVILEEHLNKMENKYVKPPIRISGFDNNLWIWEEPIENEEYLIVGDVARGDGQDYSACHVIKLSNLEQVAEYKAKLPPDLYAKFLYKLGEDYNKGLMVVEANSIGYATCLKLQEMKYPNQFYSMKGQFNARNKKKLERAFRDKENMVPGFQTTSASRPLLVSQLEEDVRNLNIKIHSIRTVNELRTLIWNNGKPEATAGYNDDLCISLGIGLLVVATTLKDITDSKLLLEETLKGISNNYTEADEVIDNLNMSIKKNQHGVNPWVMTNSQGQEEDISWLIKK